MKPKNRLLLLTLAATSTFAHTPARAATQTWLADGVTTNNTWDLTQLSWDAGAVWVNGNDAVLAPNTVPEPDINSENLTIGTVPITAGTITVQGPAEWKISGPSRT